VRRCNCGPLSESPCAHCEEGPDVGGRRLYAVTVSKLLYVVAETSGDAECIATENADDDVGEWEADATELRAEDAVPAEDARGYPWGIKEEVTIAEWRRRHQGVRQTHAEAAEDLADGRRGESE
jgi:hypothetical protein